MTNKYDPNTNAIIAQIYSIVKHWYELETSNAETGTEHERQWMNTIINFDFSGLAIDDLKDTSIQILNELFTASEQCFIPNRMRLVTSQIIERFGFEFVDILNNRLEKSLVVVWNMDKKEARELIAQFPCLWLIHVIQCFPIFPNL